jgi:hypothetical protein
VQGSVGEEFEELTGKDHHKYRCVVGKMQYIPTERPDIQFTTKELARKLAAPTKEDMRKLKHKQNACICKTTEA